MEQTDSGNSKKIIAVLAVLVVITVVIVGLRAGSGNDDQSSQVASEQTNTADSTSNVPQTSDGYKDGSYTATGSYISPGGKEEIIIKLTIAGGTVDQASAISRAKSPTGKGYQADFISGFKQFVEGKAVDEIDMPGRVSGSSLTVRGFDDALEQIKDQAKS